MEEKPVLLFYSAISNFFSTKTVSILSDDEPLLMGAPKAEAVHAAAKLQLVYCANSELILGRYNVQ